MAYTHSLVVTMVEIDPIILGSMVMNEPRVVDGVVEYDQ